MFHRTLATLVIAAVAASPAAAQLALTQVGTGLNTPLFLTAAPNDPNPNRVYVVERGGTIRTLDTATGAVAATPLLNLPSALTATSGGTLLTGGEQGLLGMAFSPGYTATGNGFVYINYVGSNGTLGGETRIDRFTVTGGVLSPTSRANIITIDQPDSQTNHKGGWLGFSPTDNYLYIATGDGGSGGDPSNFGQNNTQLLGKLLRINPNTTGTGYTIPQGQIFGAGTRAEIFATGLRNPFRNGFDPLNGDLYLGDVGQGTREEVDFIAGGSAGGQNFGWRLREGRVPQPGGNGGAPPANNTEPIYDYTRENADEAITGGYVYRGGDILDGGQSLDGTYIFGDYETGRIFSFRYDGVTGIPTNGAVNRSVETNSQSVIGTFSLASFGQDNLGRVYALDLGGQVYRITGPPLPASADFDGDDDVDGGDFLAWQRGVGTAMATRAQGDADHDRNVDGDDLAVWRHQFGEPPPLATVPEPGASTVALVLTAGLLAIRRRR